MDSTSTPGYFKCQYGRVDLLTAHNFLMWSSILPNFLRADGTWDIVQGIETAPVQPPPSRRSRQEPQNNDDNIQSQYIKHLKDFQIRTAKACSMILSSVSPSFQQFIYAMTDPAQMWTTLKTQLDSMKSNAGPFIVRSQLFKEKFNRTGPISAFFAKLVQYQTRLASTDFKIYDIDLISHVLSPNILPSKFESTLEVLRLQPNTKWSELTQILINKEL